MNIGERIKLLRKERKMTLVELSENSSVQIATLSRMENGKMTGTLESHMNIAKALGLELPQLYEDIELKKENSLNAVDVPIMDSFTYNDKASYEILAKNVLSKKMMPVVLKIEPRGKTSPEQNVHGAEKFIFILDGSIIVHILEKEYPLSKNHTLYFDASLKHYFENNGETPARIISVVTPVSL